MAATLAGAALLAWLAPFGGSARAQRCLGAARARPVPIPALRAPAARPASLRRPAPASLPAPRPPAPPPSGVLQAADPADAAWLGDLVERSGRSRSARAVLAQVSAVALAQDRRVVVATEETANSGEYHFDWDTVILRKGMKRRNPDRAATVLIHELVHFLQRQSARPSDALELELEGYLVDMRMGMELGYKPRKGSYDARVQAALRKGVWDFVAWVRKEYKNEIPLAGSRLSKYLAKLAERRAEAERDVERRRRRLERARANLAVMEDSGYSPQSVAAYREDVILPAEGGLGEAERTLAWVRRDQAMLSTPEGAKAYRAWVRTILGKARRLHVRLNKIEG